jgi:DNA mismatch repair protein MSH6
VTLQVLDSTALLNMDIIANSETGGKEGTLIEKIDHCCTPFGKRYIQTKA